MLAMFDQDDSPKAPLYQRLSIELLGSTTRPTPHGEAGHHIALETTRGTIQCALHEPARQQGIGVLWISGARGGITGPANGAFRDLSSRLVHKGIASLRLDYRHPADLDESVLDALCGVWHLANIGYPRIALVGHSFGGGVALSTARYTTHVRAVAALASQTMGAEDAVLLNGRPLLLVHGDADAVLPLSNSQTIYRWAPEPKELLVLSGAGHGLREGADELRNILEDWLLNILKSS